MTNTSYKVALWENRLAARAVAELIIDADTPLNAAILAMEKYNVAAMPVVVVMDNEKQTTYFDMEWGPREQALFFSKTEEFSRFSPDPLLENSKKWRA